MKWFQLGHIAALAAMALLLAACNSKEDDPVPPDPQPGPDPTPEESLRLGISLEALGGEVLWSLPKSVRVFEEDGDGAVLTRGDDGFYTGSLKGSDKRRVVLMPSDNARYGSEMVTASFPTVQQGVAGYIPLEAAFGIGVTDGDAVTLRPVVGGLVLRFEREDVFAVTLTGNTGEDLGGSLRIDPASGAVRLLSGARSLRLEASIGVLDKDSDWVLALPPVSLARGVTLSVETLEGSYEWAAEDVIDITAGHFVALTVPDGLKPEEPTPDYIPIPDANFKAWLVERYDSDKDGEISANEALAVTAIEVSTHEIHSLEGIRYFTNLETLSAIGSRASDRTILGQLTALDLSGLGRLSSVTVRHNHITTLTLSGNDALKTLICYGNSLTSLDLRGAPMLDHVDAGDCAIETADLSANTFLRILALHNNRLQALDLSHNPSLQSLTCDRNLLRSLDVSANTALTSLDCAPMDDDAGANLLETLTLSYGMAIAGITTDRSNSYIPDATQLVWVGAPDPTTLGTGLRTMYITTPTGGGIYSKDTWTEGCTVKLVDDAGTVYYENAAVSVKGRGNSTWGYPKKPYTLKLPVKADLIGTGADKRWVLLANWMDRTLLRNDVAFEIGRRSELEWTPSGEFIELFLNGQHLGNYWLGEKIKSGKARLQCDYLLEMDTYYDAQWRFYSSYGLRVNQNATGMPIGVKEPDDDEITEAQFATLQELVAGVENALYNQTADYRTLMDVTSFIDWYLVHEVTYNGEPNHPKSCYFYFRNGIMYAGPLWDFDWYTFQRNTSGLFLPNAIYFGQLMKDESFKTALKARWAELKVQWADIPDYIQRKADEIKKSEAINWSMWPCTSSSVNQDERLSFDQAIARMKSAFTARMSVLDTAINKL